MMSRQNRSSSILNLPLIEAHVNTNQTWDMKTEIAPLIGADCVLSAAGGDRLVPQVLMSITETSISSGVFWGESILVMSCSSVSHWGMTLGTSWVRLALGLMALMHDTINMCLYKPAGTSYCDSGLSNDTHSTLSPAHKSVSHGVITLAMCSTLCSMAQWGDAGIVIRTIPLWARVVQWGGNSWFWGHLSSPGEFVRHKRTLKS